LVKHVGEQFWIVKNASRTTEILWQVQVDESGTQTPNAAMTMIP